jgi:hypothetical protein
MILLVAGAAVSQAPTLAKGLRAQQMDLFSATGSATVLIGLVVLLAGLVAGVTALLTAVGVARIKRKESVDSRMVSA